MAIGAITSTIAMSRMPTSHNTTPASTPEPTEHVEAVGYLTENDQGLPRECRHVDGCDDEKARGEKPSRARVRHG